MKVKVLNQQFGKYNMFDGYGLKFDMAAGIGSKSIMCNAKLWRFL